MRASSVLSVASILVWAAAGCGGSSGQGGERQACYANGTCNTGLTCASNVCVKVSGGAGGTGGSAAGTRGDGGSTGGRGGDGATGGVSGTTGAGGSGGASGTGGTTATGGGVAGSAGTGGVAGMAGGGAGGMAGVGGAGGMAGASGAGGMGGASGAGGMAGASGAGGGAGAAGTGGVAGQAGGTSCGSIDRPSSKLPPDILIVQDASGSMNQDAINMTCQGGCGANSKWALMIPAINQVVRETQANVNWGLKLFADVGAQCGVSPNTVAVNIGPNNAAAIETALMGRTDAAGNVTNGSSTPTRAAEDAAVTYLMARAADPMPANPKFILLATDGQPNCPMTGQSSADDGPGAVAAVTAARTAGFPTFVVGIATSGSAADVTLNAMATAGGYPQMGAATQYYGVSDTAGFVNVLRTLVGVATTCTFSVPPPPTSDGTTSRGDIGVRGTVGSSQIDINQDATNGWTYADTGMTSVVLHGAACDQWAAQTITAITIVFHCRTQ